MARFRHRLSFVVLFAVAGSSSGSSQGPDLPTGIRQAKDGDFEQALLTLDLVARKLATEPGRAKDLAQAYLYMGVAYVGLGQEGLAKAKFQQALRQDRELRLSPDEFPPKVLRGFEAARAEFAEAATLEKEAKKKKGKGGLILLGLGGAGAAGIALAVAPKERANTPPQVAMTIAPEGQAISGVTTMRFTATATDAEGDPLSLRWDFGDGDSASGAATTHVYTQEGTFNVRLSVGDGLASTTATGRVTARGMRGIWRVVGQAFVGVTEFELDGGTPGFGFITRAGGVPLSVRGATGLITDPRTIVMRYVDCRNNSCLCEGQPCVCSFRFDGLVDPTLQTLTGTLACSDQNRACPCGGQTQQLTLARQ